MLAIHVVGDSTSLCVKSWQERTHCTHTVHADVDLHFRLLSLLAKETIFDLLTQSPFFTSGGFIIITGRGQPDDATKSFTNRNVVVFVVMVVPVSLVSRRYTDFTDLNFNWCAVLATGASVRRLARQLRCPFVGLCDFNPFGLQILCTVGTCSSMMHDDVGLSHSAHLFVRSQPATLTHKRCFDSTSVTVQIRNIRQSISPARCRTCCASAPSAYTSALVCLECDVVALSKRNFAAR